MQFSLRLIGVALLATLSLLNSSQLQAQECSFCNQEVIARQKIYEDEHIVVLYDHKPIIRGHALVIPKRHVEQLQDVNGNEILFIHKAIGKLFEASKAAYGSTCYLILEKNGKAAGQSVPHVHFHFFPRKEGDYTDTGLLARFYFSKFYRPLDPSEIELERHLLAEHFMDRLEILE